MILSDFREKLRKGKEICPRSHYQRGRQKGQSVYIYSDFSIMIESGSIR